jgi:curved DNA-binding protein CbpA
VSFIDYYELLEISPNANSETVERVFRYLARRFHPDNQATGDRDRFDLVLEAFDILRDAAKRAQYDAEYRSHSSTVLQLAVEANDFDCAGGDADMQARLLALFYVRRRREVFNPGLGEFEIAQMMGCPPERLDFHLWYLKEKRWIARMEDGTFAITADGVDQAGAEQQAMASRKLIVDRST